MEPNKNYRKGDIVYIDWVEHHGACPARYVGRFKDRFDINGWACYFEPISSPWPYATIYGALDGKITELIPFSSKPPAYGKVKR